MTHTRSLETTAVYRASVQEAQPIETGSHHILLRTKAVMASKRAVSSADSEMLNQRSLAGVGKEVEGRVRIDALGERILRVRYAEGAALPENRTPMLAAPPQAGGSCTITRGVKSDPVLKAAPWLAESQRPPQDEVVTIATPAFVATVSLAPYRIEITTPDGRAISGVGGPEKDAFCNWDAYNTGVCRTLDGVHPVAAECFDLLPDEAIYGLGEKFIRLNKVGQTIDLNMVDALGVTTGRSYKNIPFFVSTRGYGVFFNHSSLMTYWIGSRSACDLQVAAEDDFLDYFICIGDIRQVLGLYTDLTGKGVMPPRWTFGYWQSKISYKAADETLEIARKMREHQVPCDVIHLDTHWFKQDWYCDLEFDRERFPEPAAYLRQLADLGIKISLWQLPYIPEGSELFNDLKAVDGFVKNATGEIYNCGICFTPGFKGIVGVVDYTNPKAVKVHQRHFRRLFQLGAKVIKTDFGEAAPLDGVYHDGTPGSRMHNLYPLLYNRAVFDVTKETTGDGVVWARSAWAGSQRYPLHWGGDNSPNAFNIIPQLEGGLSFGLSGFQFWSQDIGGFCGTTNDALLIRWMQVGMFTSHSRIHGFGDRELYKFRPETLRICRDFIQLRYRLLPYIFAQAERCVRESLPMMRALVVDYQNDPTTFNLSDEFLFGDDLLVAPIVTADPHRKVYLPAGTWTCWWAGKRLPGARWIDVEAGLETLPLYIREGGIIPLGPVMNYVDEKPLDRLEVRLGIRAGDGRSSTRLTVNGKEVQLTYETNGGRHLLRVVGSPVPVSVAKDEGGHACEVVQETR